MDIRTVTIIALVVCVCHGSMAFTFFPRLTNPWLKLTGDRTGAVSNNPFVAQKNIITGNVFGDTANVFSPMPLSFERYLENNRIPTLPLLNLDRDSSANLLAEFNTAAHNEDVNLSIEGLIVKYGYTVQRHTVVTEDGYVLELFRIPGDGPVVFLMHGLVASSDYFAISGPEDSLAFLLARDGYDVWMGNARGNKHSRRHVTLTPDDPSFWDFSWHEIGVYDLPAMIDYTLNTAGAKTLTYIGHSQGTTSFFVMASERPEYNSKISLMVALAPVAYMYHVKSPLVRMMAPGGPLIHAMSKTFGYHEYLPDNALMRQLKTLMCGTSPLAQIFCAKFVFLIFGFDFAQLNVTNLAVFFGHEPSGASMKQVVHYGQGVLRNDFRKFDYGAIENLNRYGSVVPPRYQLSNINTPVSLFWSEDDWLAQPRDVEMLYNQLRNASYSYKVPFRPFNHLDYITAKDIKTLIYGRLRELLGKFAQN